MSQSEAFIDMHLQNIVNIGCPQNNDDADSLQEYQNIKKHTLPRTSKLIHKITTHRIKIFR